MGRDKALIQLDGVPLVVHVVGRLSSVADPVILAPGIAGRLGSLGLPEVVDELPDAGPLGGLVAGLAASPHQLVATLAVDMPFASPEVFRLLASLHRGEDAIVPVTVQGLQPLHAVYSRRALPALRASLRRGERALRQVLGELRITRVAEERWRPLDATGRFAVNINTAADLAVTEVERPE
jgi:molybdopterin-guanine dinucleotide biosynthesis protein A